MKKNIFAFTLAEVISVVIVLGIVALVFALTWLIKWITLWPWWCFIILGGVLVVGLNLLIKYCK